MKKVLHFVVMVVLVALARCSPLENQKGKKCQIPFFQHFSTLESDIPVVYLIGKKSRHFDYRRQKC